MGPVVRASSTWQYALSGPGRCGTPRKGEYGGRCGYGPRLPLLVLSPWARPNFVDHRASPPSRRPTAAAVRLRRARPRDPATVPGHGRAGRGSLSPPACRLGDPPEVTGSSRPRPDASGKFGWAWEPPSSLRLDPGALVAARPSGGGCVGGSKSPPAYRPTGPTLERRSAQSRQEIDPRVCTRDELRFPVSLLLTPGLLGGEERNGALQGGDVTGCVSASRMPLRTARCGTPRRPSPSRAPSRPSPRLGS